MYHSDSPLYSVWRKEIFKELIVELSAASTWSVNRTSLEWAVDTSFSKERGSCVCVENEVTTILKRSEQLTFLNCRAE